MEVPFVGNAMMVIFISAIVNLIIDIFLITNKKSNGEEYSVRYYIVQGLFINFCIFIAVCTIAPSGISGRSINLVPFKDTVDMVKYIGFVQVKMMLYNVLLFIPFGVFGTIMLDMKGREKTLILLYGLIFSFAVEFAQFLLDIGRSSDIDDIIMNFVGTLIGYGFGLALLKCIGALKNRYMDKIQD